MRFLTTSARRTALTAAAAIAAALVYAPMPAFGHRSVSASAASHVVMAWSKPSYDPAKPGPIWQSLYRPSKWDDGDDVVVTNAHWSTWTSQQAVARVRMVIAGERGVGHVRLFHPGYCAAIKRRAFLRMRFSGGEWGSGTTENLSQSCAGD